MSFALKVNDTESVVAYAPQFGGYKVPEGTKIKSAFGSNEIETILMSVEELINIDPWLGNRNSLKRLDDKARREAMSGDFDLSHGIHFEIGELKNYDTWRSVKDGVVSHTSFQPGTRFLHNGNTRAWAIRKGYFDSVPSHVRVNIIKMDTLEDLQGLYWKIDSAFCFETQGDVFQAIYDDIGFIPKSNQYRNSGSFGTALSRYGALANPQLWGKYGFSVQGGVYPLDHEDYFRAKNRLMQEMFTCYIAEMRFNDEQLERKKTADQRWDATTAIAHMLKYRADGFRITPIHQEVLDAIFDGGIRTPDKVDSPIQYILAEMVGLGQGACSDDKVEFPSRGNWGNPVIGAKPAVAKQLFYLQEMEKVGRIDQKKRMKRSVTKGGSFDYIKDFLDPFLADNKIFFMDSGSQYIGNVPRKKVGRPSKKKTNTA
jgi:hypothetical protein